MQIVTLGEARFPSPIARSVNGVESELAGPRAKLFFEPAKTRAGIVTCGGLCPGLNNVIRWLFLELCHTCGVKEVLGFRNG